MGWGFGAAGLVCGGWGKSYNGVEIAAGKGIEVDGVFVGEGIVW